MAAALQNDPPWLKRTTACPFLNRGRCIFAAKCNFIHPSTPSPQLQATWCRPVTPTTAATSSPVYNEVRRLARDIALAYLKDQVQPIARTPEHSPILSNPRRAESISTRTDSVVHASPEVHASLEAQPLPTREHTSRSSTPSPSRPQPKLGRVSFLASLSEILEIRYGLTKSDKSLRQANDDEHGDTTSSVPNGSDVDITSFSTTFTNDSTIVSDITHTEPGTTIVEFPTAVLSTAEELDSPPTSHYSRSENKRSTLGSPFALSPVYRGTCQYSKPLNSSAASDEDSLSDSDVESDSSGDMDGDELDLTVRQDFQCVGNLSSWTQSPPEAESSEWQRTDTSLLELYADQPQSLMPDRCLSPQSANSTTETILTDGLEPNPFLLAKPKLKPKLKSNLRPLRLPQMARSSSPIQPLPRVISTPKSAIMPKADRSTPDNEDMIRPRSALDFAFNHTTTRSVATDLFESNLTNAEDDIAPPLAVRLSRTNASDPGMHSNSTPYECKVSTTSPGPSRRSSRSSLLPGSQLFFAIARDSPKEVATLLANGDASPNETCGHHTALAFAAENGNLVNRCDIVLTLLAHGADPSVLAVSDKPATLDPYIQYFINRTRATQVRQSKLAITHIVRFAPLTQLSFGIVGQDMVIGEFYRAIAMNELTPEKCPLVFMLCGPSGHGKSLFAQKVGELLRYPSKTFNLTMLGQSQDIWTLPALNESDVPGVTLGEYLHLNDGKECVVILDEIEKTENIKVLWSLLVPWELGRTTLPSGIAVRTKNVIWIATSNLGQEMVMETLQSSTLEYQWYTEYRSLMTNVRTLFTEHFGPSLISRVTAVLPFIPFSLDELSALASLCIAPHVKFLESQGLSKDQILQSVVEAYRPEEGMRSLQRAAATVLLDMGTSVI